MEPSALTQSPNRRVSVPTTFDNLSDMADRLAAASVFDDYMRRKAPNTIKTQRTALLLFARYLIEKTVKASRGRPDEVIGVRVSAATMKDEEELAAASDVIADSLQSDPAAWYGIRFGLIKGFMRWQLNKGYSIASINNRLAAVKVYAGLAHQAGILSADDLLKIKAVKGYSRKEGKQEDKQRPITRIGHKKAEHTPLKKEQAAILKQQHEDTPQGRRDRLMMCLLLEMGLRVGEVVLLGVKNFDLQAGLLTFFRPKVDEEQTHILPPQTLAAARRYIQMDARPETRLLLATNRDGKLKRTPMKERAINNRVGELGRAILGIDNLSPHDCRHYWATNAAKNGTDPFALQEGGGWKSLTMPRLYVERAAIANEKIILDKDE